MDFSGIDVAKETLDDQSKTQCIANSGTEIGALVNRLKPLAERIGRDPYWRPRAALSAQRQQRSVRPVCR
jgi:hypothetical protein